MVACIVVSEHSSPSASPKVLVFHTKFLTRQLACVPIRMLQVVSTGTYYPPVVTGRFFPSGASYLTTVTTASKTNKDPQALR